MWKFAAVSVLALVTGAANACECGFLSEEAAATSKTAFVFQVVRSELHMGRKDDLLDDGAVAQIRVVQNLRGRAVATHISYSTGWCCGPRLIVGGYYAAFLPGNPRAFAAGLGNIVSLGPLYQPSSSVPAPLKALLQGKEGADGFLEQSYQRLSQVPPPPCPPPKRRNGL
jgi:hypothetical protein